MAIFTIPFLSAIYIVYFSTEYLRPLQLIVGEFPSEVHILVDRFLIEEVPTDKIILEQVVNLFMIDYYMSFIVKGSTY